VEVLKEGEALLKSAEVGREVEGGGQVIVETGLESCGEGGGRRGGRGRGTAVLQLRESAGSQGTFKGCSACSRFILGMGNALFVIKVESGDEGGVKEALIDLGEKGGLLLCFLPGVAIEKDVGEI
jgi:hypothetical protein